MNNELEKRRVRKTTLRPSFTSCFKLNQQPIIQINQQQIFLQSSSLSLLVVKMCLLYSIHALFSYSICLKMQLPCLTYIQVLHANTILFC